MSQEIITVQEWVDELRRICEQQDEGYSCEEYADKLGVCVSTARKRLNAARRSGRLRSGFRMEPALDGKSHKVPVYVVV